MILIAQVAMDILLKTVHLALEAYIYLEPHVPITVLQVNMQMVLITNVKVVHQPASHVTEALVVTAKAVNHLDT